MLCNFHLYYNIVHMKSYQLPTYEIIEYETLYLQHMEFQSVLVLLLPYIIDHFAR